MKTFFSLTLILFSITVLAQAPAIQWQKSLGGTSDEYANDIKPTNDGGYIVAGYSMSVNGDVSGNHGMKDFWVVKLDAIGTIQWQQSYGGSFDDVASSVQQTTDGGYVVAGSTHSNDGDVTITDSLKGNWDYWVVKLSPSGIIQWEKVFGGTSAEEADEIQETSDGGYIVVGTTESSNGDITFSHGGADYWVIKLTSTGTIQWQKTYGGSSFDNGYSIQQTSDSGFIISGGSSSSNGDVTLNQGQYDFWIIKINATGTIQWQKSYGGSITDVAFMIKQTTDGGYVMAGCTYSSDGDVTQNYAPQEFWIVKTDSSGTIQYKKTCGGQGNDIANSIEQTTNGGYIVAGTTSSSGTTGFDVSGNHGVNDCWIVKLNDTLGIEWENCYGGPWDDGATAIHQTTDGGFIFTGHSMNTGGDVTATQGGHDFWVVKLNAFVGIDEINNEGDVVIYPNPTTGELRIRKYELGITEVRIYNVLGECVFQSTINNNQSTININQYPKGIYFVEVKTAKGMWRKKFVKQ